MAQFALSAGAADAAAEPQLMVQTGHSTFDRYGALYLLDNDRLLVSILGNEAILWDFRSGQQIREFTSGISIVRGSEAAGLALPAFDVHHNVPTPQGFSSDEAFPILWDGNSGAVLKEFSLGLLSGMHQRFSPKLTYVAGYGVGPFDLWDVNGAKKMWGIHGGAHPSIEGVAFSRDERTIGLADGRGGIELWDIQAGKKRFEQQTSIGTPDLIAVAPDDRTIAMASYRSREVRVVDMASGAQLYRQAFTRENVEALAFSPRKNLLVIATNESRLLIDIPSKSVVRQWGVPTWGLASMVFDGSGEQLVELMYDTDGRTKAVVRDVAGGGVARTMEGSVVYADHVDASPDGRRLLLSNSSNELAVWEIPRDRAGTSRSAFPTWPFWPFFGGDGSLQVIAGSINQAVIIDPVSHVQRGTIQRADALTGVAVSGDFALAAHFGLVEGSGLRVTNLKDESTREIDTSSIGTPVALRALAFLPDNRRLVAGLSQSGFFSTGKLDLAAGDLAAADYKPPTHVFRKDTYPSALIIDAVTGNVLRRLVRAPVVGAEKADTLAAAASKDGRQILTSHTDGQFTLWDADSGMELATFPGRAVSLAFLADGHHVIAADQGVAAVWNLDQRKIVARLFALSGGGWAVTDPAGHFDTDDLEQIKGLHWSMPDDPMTPVPVEAFLRDYYEPRLLQRILNAEQFRAVPDLATIKRVQPLVRITGAVPDPKNAARVLVQLEASGASEDVRHGASVAHVRTGAQDLRLFRDGQLVGYADGAVAAAGKGPYRAVFPVALPAGRAAVEFTAYAFNDDRVKSKTAHLRFEPAVAVTAKMPRAWVITVGINRHENPDWDLHYAVNDAHRISDSVERRLIQMKRYREVVPIVLAADSIGDNQGRKSQLKAVLDRLAGRAADVRDVPGGERLDRVEPDDLVLISFSGHGVTVDGEFYLIPADTGPGQGRIVTPTLLTRAISADELAHWLRDVDGGAMAMIIDACQSAASVGTDFKPGPMGARGLGQLAYEKGMRILVASQADESAQESQLTQQGLLSYALVNDGLESGKADFQPQDQRITLAEWLNYAEQRVPGLAEEVIRGKLHGAGGRGAVLLRAQPDGKTALQQPALFDFSKGSRDVIIAE